MRFLYIDAFSGVSGDKFNAALLSLGVVDLNFLRKELSSLKVKDEFEISIIEKKISGIAALKFEVVDKNHNHGSTGLHSHSQKGFGLVKKIEDTHSHRGLKEIKDIILSSAISDNAKKYALDIFNIIGEAEAKAHSTSIDEVHFHEVGAIDSIVDIVSAAVLIDSLKIDKIISSPIAVGSGTINSAHGILPVPAPATADILKDVPICGTSIKGELTTPTGAALIKYFVSEFSNLPLMTVEKIGYGAGTKSFDIPNYLRVFLGEEYKHSDFKSDDSVIVQIEANIDDSTPEQIAFLTEKLLESGALDVFVTPIVMKKGRQAQLLTVLSSVQNKDVLETIIFLNSTTFGLRFIYLNRVVLNREFTTINVEGVPVKVKLGYLNGKVVQKAFEYESIKNGVKETSLSYNEFFNRAIKELNQKFS